MNYVAQTASSGFFPNNPDETGQVFAYRFRADGRLASEGEEAAWTWRSYLASDIRARMTIERDAALPAPVRESLLAPGHASHLDLDDNWLYGDLPDLRHDYSIEARGLGHFRFALDDKTLIGGCKQPLRSIDHVRQLAERGTRQFRSPCELVEAIISHSMDGLSGDLVKIGVELDEIEDRIVGEHWHNERQQLNETRRRLVLIHRQMASVASLFRHLEHQHHLDLPMPVADMAARMSNRAVALNHDGEQLQAQARLLQDELMAKLGAQTNQLLYFLSLITAVLLPMTVISGLFGMNVGGIPMGENGAGFWTISLISAAVAGTVLWLLRRLGGNGM
jgi:zinc transporter